MNNLPYILPLNKDETCRVKRLLRGKQTKQQFVCSVATGYLFEESGLAIFNIPTPAHRFPSSDWPLL